MHSNFPTGVTRQRGVHDELPPFSLQQQVHVEDRTPCSLKMAKRNLLVCFDAFGTLFKPKRPIEQQYGEVARSLGLSGFTDDELKTSFRAGERYNCGLADSFGSETDFPRSVQERSKAKPELREGQWLGC